MNAPANRGKGAEKTIKEILEGFNESVAGFTYNRNLDAHAAGGRFPAQAGDYQAFMKGTYTLHPHKIGRQFEPIEGIPFSRNFIIEVKEVKHDFRLPSKNYSADKVARVLKRVWAGTEAIVVVLHTTTGLWRVVPFEVFTTRAASWDLSKFPISLNIESALAEFMGIR